MRPRLHTTTHISARVLDAHTLITVSEKSNKNSQQNEHQPNADKRTYSILFSFSSNWRCFFSLALLTPVTNKYTTHTQNQAKTYKILISYTFAHVIHIIQSKSREETNSKEIYFCESAAANFIILHVQQKIFIFRIRISEFGCSEREIDRRRESERHPYTHIAHKPCTQYTWHDYARIIGKVREQKTKSIFWLKYNSSFHVLLLQSSPRDS